MPAQELYEVERIIAKRRVKGKVEYRVVWKNYPDEKDYTWEAVSSFKQCPGVIEAFEATQKNASPARSPARTPKATSSAKRKTPVVRRRSSSSGGIASPDVVPSTKRRGAVISSASPSPVRGGRPSRSRSRSRGQSASVSPQRRVSPSKRAATNDNAAAALSSSANRPSSARRTSPAKRKATTLAVMSAKRGRRDDDDSTSSSSSREGSPDESIDSVGSAAYSRRPPSASPTRTSTSKEVILTPTDTTVYNKERYDKYMKTRSSSAASPANRSWCSIQ